VPAEGGVIRFSGVIPEAAVVDTFTEKVVVLDPLSVAELGETVQVASDGAPLQLKAIAELRPPSGVALRL